MAETGSDSRSTGSATGLLSALKTVFGFSEQSALRDRLERTLATESDDDTTAFSAQEKLMLRNILGFREVRVDDVMVPRVDIIAVEQDSTVKEILQVFKDAGHSRLPVFHDTLDEPIGMIHIKDLMGWLTSQATPARKKSRSRKKTSGETSGETGRNGTALFPELDLSKVDLSRKVSDIEIERSVLFVPPSMPAVDLLKKMQTTRSHLALVIDEYGGTEGLVSIEDLVEEIVGEIEDEHDLLHAPKVVPSDKGSFIADARILIEDFESEVGVDLGLTDAEEDIDTLGGLVFSLIGRIPVRGELITGPEDLEFEILDVDLRRIKKIRVYPKSGLSQKKPDTKKQTEPDN